MSATKAEREEIRNVMVGLTGDLSAKLEGTRTKLIEDSRALAEKLTKLSDKLTRGCEDFEINVLGVVQGQGSEIDRLCGVYRTLLEARKTAAFYINQATT